MFTVADGILIAIVLLGILLGFYRGFFKSVSKPIKVIIAACVTFCLSSYVINDFTGPYFAEKLGAVLGKITAFAVTYVGLFLATCILLGIILALLDKFFSEGVLGIVNKILGFVFGGAVAFVLACALANGIAFFDKSFVGGVVFDFFKNLNPLAIIFNI